jgi:methyltransferase (TIGR00027 family)
MLTGEPSRTARAVAAVRLDAPRVAADHGDSDAAERLERLIAGDLQVAESQMVQYLTARTWFFDQTVVDAIERGVTQIVVAAAGYDTRSLRYARPGVHWFELDHPATQTDKLARLAELDAALGEITFVSADFTIDNVTERLTTAGCDPEVESLVLAEGIATYLSLDVLHDLLSGLRRAVGAGSQLAISLSVAADDPDLQQRRAAFQERVAAVGEPVRSVITEDQAVGLLAAAGWKMKDHNDAVGAPGRTGLVTASAR